MASNRGLDSITFNEVDEADHPTATYIYTQSTSHLPLEGDGKGHVRSGRIDLLRDASSTTKSWSFKAFLDTLADVFLPTGYPHSVTEDYTPYQIFDSLQAFSSSIAGLLSSRAVLQGVGVGNADASPTSALLLHILQDSSGRLATILFAHRVGTALEPECKMYRLAADVFNDSAMVLDCVSPMVPAGALRVIVLSTAGILRALCGVAGGSSKASLSAHFSRWGNLAQVNAKDSSQETVISLLGMLVGSLVISRVTGFYSTWITLLMLLALHLSLNYAAVRSVQMTSLNRQRANIVFSTILNSDEGFMQLLSHGAGASTSTHSNPSASKAAISLPDASTGSCRLQVLTPSQVSKQERIFETDGILRWSSPAPGSTAVGRPFHPGVDIGTCRIGISLHQFLLGPSSSYPSSFFFSCLALRPSHFPQSMKTSIPLPQLSTLFKSEQYILYLGPAGNKWHARILLKSTCTPQDQLKAWVHALLTARVLSFQLFALGASSSAQRSKPQMEQGIDSILNSIHQTLTFLNQNDRYERYMGALEDAGWDLTVRALETRPGRRVGSST
ncbi:RUS1 family protein [Aspergillus saccharolyticus JOP 1030-1]|uniref:DUF647-domain-containing protein n=1 Tax=Aspergillus saccharolyticus JOP 1030-1 TaxID=1450539 RepID=A0A318ZH64_9EURO|nr:DUF647-domain-containing protein [Aspergillus saccharolyticus JOP 1030-1]PYH46097.1 DUF647-domain-containing protein [Aspergillus saccharolyticus JOP 1030-1]